MADARLRPKLAAVIALLLPVACGGPGSDPRARLPGGTAGPPAWCAAVQSALGDAAIGSGLRCLDVPNFLVTGFYGTEANPERSDFAGGCLGGAPDAAERLRIAVRPIGDLRFRYSSDIRVSAGGSVDLGFLGPWAPRLSGSAASEETLTVDVELADAEIRVLSSVAEILGQTYREALPGGPGSLEACLETLCDGAFESLVYTAKVIAAVPVIRVRSSSGKTRVGGGGVLSGLAGFEVKDSSASGGTLELKAKEKLNVAAVLEPARAAFERARTCQALRDGRARREIVAGLREIGLRTVANRDLAGTPQRLAELRRALARSEQAFTDHEERDLTVCMEALGAASRDLASPQPGQSLCDTRDLLGSVLGGGSADDRLHEVVIDVAQPLHRRLTEIADDRGLPCAAPPFFRDEDGDGFGDPGQVKRAPKAPPGYVENSLDCFDRDASVHPGQRGFFAEPRADGRYDYDCDTRETLENEVLAGGCKQITRFGIPIRCWAEPGFRSKVPRCGEQGRFFEECVEGMLSCDEGPERTVRQRCR